MEEIERLITALNDPDRNVRLHAIVELGKARDLRAVEPLLAILRRDNEEEIVIKCAIEALGKIGDPRAIAPLIGHRYSGFAAEALVRIGAPAIEPLIATWRNPEARLHRKAIAAQVLGKIGAPAIEPLVAALNDPDKKVRLFAATTLSEMGDPRAIEPLAAALNDPDRKVRQFAATTLGERGDLRAIRPLFAMLRDPDTVSVPRMATVKAISRTIVMLPVTWPILVIVVGMILGWTGGATDVGLGGIISGAIVGTFLGASEGAFGNRGAVNGAINGALVGAFSAAQPDKFAMVIAPLIIVAVIGWIGFALIKRTSKVMSKRVVSIVGMALLVALIAALIALILARPHAAIVMAIYQQPATPVAVAAGLAIIFARIYRDKKLAARPTSLRLFEALAGAIFGVLGAALGLAIFMAIRG